MYGRLGLQVDFCACLSEQRSWASRCRRVAIREDDVVVDERLPDLPTAITTLARDLEQASSGMDVIKIELEANQTSARLVFCAYRHKPTPPFGNDGRNHHEVR
jgi:hypothetical protein